jgi:hypothetical protein
MDQGRQLRGRGVAGLIESGRFFDECVSWFLTVALQLQTCSTTLSSHCIHGQRPLSLRFFHALNTDRSTVDPSVRNQLGLPTLPNLRPDAATGIDVTTLEVQGLEEGLSAVRWLDWLSRSLCYGPSRGKAISSQGTLDI